MNENIKRINSFLIFLKKILKENPDFKITKNNIYEWITKLDVSPKEYDEDLKKYGWFEEWKEKYKIQNRSGYNPDSYFCRFANKEQEFINITNPIKIYIPSNINNVKKTFEKIMNYLNDKNIAYLIKIGREIRIDNIVVRLTNENDVKELIDFINNDSYIKEGLGKPSPFCFDYNGLALTLDGHLSYHSIVVNYIYNFITEKKNNDDLDSINYDNFYNYIKNEYSNKYENFKDFSKIEIENYDDKISSGRNLLIDKQITNLMLKVNENDFKEQNFFNTFNDFNNLENIEKEINDLCVLRILCSIIKLHGEKYGAEKTLNAIKKYIETNDVRHITGRLALREDIINNNFIYKLNIFLEKYNTTLDEIFMILGKDELKITRYNKISKDEIEKLKTDTNKKMLNIIDDLALIEIDNYKNDNVKNNNSEIIQNAIISSIKKLKRFYVLLDPRIITREKKLRQRCISIIENLRTLLYNTDEKLEDYLKKLVKDSILLKESILESSIYSTYNKYQNLYENGEINYDGESFVKYSLELFLKENNLNGFTTDNNARNNLSILSKDDAIKIISKKLSKPNIKTILHSDEKRLDIIEQYISTIIENYINITEKHVKTI